MALQPSVINPLLSKVYNRYVDYYIYYIYIYIFFVILSFRNQLVFCLQSKN